MTIREVFLSCCAFVLLAACSGGPQTSQSGPDATIKEDPWVAVHKVAVRMEETGDIRSAEKLYLQSLSQKQDFEPAIQGLERVAAKAEDELLRLAIQGHRVGQGQASKLQRRSYARNLLRAGYAEEAARQFKFLTELGGAPQDYSLLGLALDHLGRHEAARVEYDKAVSDGYEPAQLKNNKALSLALSGKYNEAVEELRSLSGSKNRAVTLNLAAFLDLAGDTEKALDLLDGRKSDLDRTLAQFRDLKTAIETGRYSGKDHPQLRL